MKNLDELKKKIPSDIQADLKEVRESVQAVANVLTEQEKINQYKIEELKSNDYYVAKMSKHKGLIFLINSFFAVFLEVELLEELHKKLLKKYGIKITTKKPLFKYHEKPTTQNTTFIILSHHIAELMDKSLIDNGKNVIFDGTLKSFGIILDLENKIKTQQHQKAISKIAKEFLQDIEQTHYKEQGYNLRVRSSYYADKILDELRWRGIEE